MTADLSVSMDRDGIVAEIDGILSPDEARDAASMLNDAADRFEQAEYQFPSRQVGSPR